MPGSAVASEDFWLFCAVLWLCVPLGSRVRLLISQRAAGWRARGAGECLVEVCRLAVADRGHAEAACGLGVRGGVVDEQALVGGGVDRLCGGGVDAGVGFGVADAGGVDDGVEEFALF